MDTDLQFLAAGLRPRNGLRFAEAGALGAARFAAARQGPQVACAGSTAPDSTAESTLWSAAAGLGRTSSSAKPTIHRGRYRYTRLFITCSPLADEPVPGYEPGLLLPPMVHRH